MKKIINPYREKTYNGRVYNVFMKLEYEEGRLSISGVEGPLNSGNCLGGCGQIIMNFKEYDSRGYMSINDIPLHQFNHGWNRKKLKKFFDIWDEWHLNDMQAACEHQRELEWTYENHHGMFVEVQRKVVVIDEYDDGTSNDPLQEWNDYKGHLCPICGYSIGSQWLTKEVPKDVINFLFFELPISSIKPAWA